MKPIIFSEGDSKTFEKLLREEMEPTIKHYEKELIAIRAGRASSALLDPIKVEAYGQLMSIKELGSIATPDPRLITIQPWDKTTIPDIEKAILGSDVGITPINDGNVIRLQFPMVSSERREELVKILGKKTEESRVSVRNVRKEFHNQLREAEKERLISEDFAKRLNDILQKLTDQYIEKIDGSFKKKETELRQF